VPPAQVTPTPAQVAVLPNAFVIPSSGVEVRYSNDWSSQSQDNTSITLGTTANPAAIAMVLDLGPLTGPIDASQLATAVQAQTSNLADAQIVAALNPNANRVVIVFRDPETSGTLYRIYDVDIDAVATTAVIVTVGEADVDAAVSLVGRSVQVAGQPVMTDMKQLVPQIFPTGV
jgi:hypothetical protein